MPVDVVGVGTWTHDCVGPGRGGGRGWESFAGPDGRQWGGVVLVLVGLQVGRLVAYLAPP